MVPLYILSENTWKGKIKLQLYHNSFTKYQSTQETVKLGSISDQNSNLSVPKHT